MPETVTLTHNVQDVATDAYSVVLSSADGTFGIKESETGNVVVPNNTAVTHASTGVYTYTFTPTSPTYTYVVSWAIQDEPTSAVRYTTEEYGPYTFPVEEITAIPTFKGTFAQGSWALFSLQTMNIRGQAIAVQNVTVELKEVAGSVIFTDTPNSFRNGLYLYDWSIGNANTGDYLVTWRYTYNNKECVEIQSVFVSPDSTPNEQHTAFMMAIRLRFESYLGTLQRTLIQRLVGETEDYQSYTFVFGRWNQSAGCKVYRNKKLVTTGYDVDWMNGVVIFDNPLTEYDEVMADFNFRIFSDDEIDTFMLNGLNMLNIYTPQTNYTFNFLADMFVPVVMQGGAIEAIRVFMQRLIWPETRALFETPDQADKAFDYYERLKKNYEETWKAMLEQKNKFPYAGLTALIITPFNALPGGRARMFQFLFGGGQF